MKMIKPLLTILAIILFSASGFCFYTTGESGEVLSQGKYRMGLEPQFKFSDGNAFNISAFADMGLGNESSARAYFGTGDTELLFGGSYKWIPFPDYKNQPAFGGKIEAMYARKSSAGLWALKLHPIFSKKVDTEAGLFIPYGSIPIGLVNFESTNITTVQLVIGTEFKTESAKDFTFGGEVGLNGSKSFSYISAFVSMPFEFPNKRSDSSSPSQPISQPAPKRRK